MRKRSTNGFTLVELLIVIGIIAVLISLLLPALNKARQSSIQLNCLSNLRQYQQLNQLYCNDNRGFYIPIEIQSPEYTAPSGYVGTWSSFGWYQNIWYPDIRGLFNFPPSPGYYGQGSAFANQLCQNAIYAQTHPTGDGFLPIQYSYGMNYSDFDDPGNTYGPNDRSTFFGNVAPYPLVPAISYNSAHIQNSSDKIAWACSMAMWINYNSSQSYVGEANTANTMIAYRHNGGTTVAFFDGHAEWKNRKEVDKTYLSTGQITHLWFAYQP